MAIDTIIISQNSSIMPDKVLSLSLNLIPILKEVENFEEKRK